MINISKQEHGVSEVDPLMQIFLNKVEAFSQENPEEGQSLRGEVMLWVSAIPGGGSTNWDIIKSQILYNVNRYNNSGCAISPEEYLDLLFEPNPAGKIDHEIIMARFQLG